MSSDLRIYVENVGLVPFGDPANTEADHGQIICRHGAQLDVLARTLGVQPLTSFHFADPDMLSAILSELDGPQREKVERVLASQQEWHRIEDGRRTTEALLTYFDDIDDETAIAGHAKFMLYNSLEPVRDDLRALAWVLGHHQGRFRLETL